MSLVGAGVTFQVEHCVELFGTNSADIGAGSWVGNFCVLLQKRGGGKDFQAQVALEGFLFFVAQSVFHQCCSRLKDLIALIATVLFVHLFIRLCVCGMGEVVQFQCIAPFKSHPADLTQIFPLVAVHGVHVSVYMLHPLRLVLAEVALQVDRVHGLGSF